MLKVILKVTVWVLVMAGIGYGARQQVPYYWGNKAFHYKYRHMQQVGEPYNVIFFGSSAVYRHFIPRLFDNRVKNLFPAHSFNFGIAGMTNPENLIMMEQLLHDTAIDLSAVRLIVMDMEHLDRLLNGNEESARVKGYMDLNALRQIWPQFTERPNAKEVIGRYLTATAAHYFCTGIYDDMYEWRTTRHEVDSAFYRRYLGRNGDGYFSLNRDYMQTWRNEEFEPQKDSTLPAQVAYARAVVQDPAAYDVPNPSALAAHASRLIALAKARGIHLLFVIPPRMMLEQVYGVVGHLPEQHLLFMGDPDAYPMLFKPELAFDGKHFNEAGARVFTAQFIRAARPILDSIATVMSTEREPEQ